MSAKSKAQQKAAGAALAAKRGEADVTDLEGASKKIYETMSRLDFFQSSSQKGCYRAHQGKKNQNKFNAEQIGKNSKKTAE